MTRQGGHRLSDPFDVDAEPSPEENERNQELLAELGLALFVAQAVEYHIVSLLAAAAIRDRKEIPRDGIRELMDTRYRRTLGRLIREVREGVDLSDDAIRFLEIALPARNWLTHHFYRQYAGAAFSDRMSHEALTLVRHARELFEATLDELARETTRVLGEAGITEEQAKERAEAAMRAALGPDLDTARVSLVRG